MKTDIINFVKEAVARYKIEAWYMPSDDLYVITKNGRAVQNFTSYHFYQQPKYFRLREWRAIINQGLAQNSGEKSMSDQTYQVRSFGIKVA